MTGILILSELAAIQHQFEAKAKTLDYLASDYSQKIAAIRGNPGLTDIGKGQALKPVLQEMDDKILPPMAEAQALHSKIISQRAPWADPLQVIRVHEPSILRPGSTSAESIGVCRMSLLAEAQAATPEQRQTLLDFAIEAGLWWQVPVILLGVVNGKGASILPGFRGVSYDTLLVDYPTWREGLAIIQDVEAQFMRISMNFNSIEKGSIDPLKRLQLGRKLEEVQKLKAPQTQGNTGRADALSKVAGMDADQRLQNRIQGALRG